MNLFLMRHAEALREHEWRKSDESRPLSKNGKAGLEAALAKIQKSQLSPSPVIVTSPYVRARETADIMARLNPGVAPVVDSLLASGARPEAYRQAIDKFKSNSSVLVVGHMPDVVQCAARLTGDIYLMEKTVAPGTILALRLDWAEAVWGKGELLWEKNLGDW